MNGKEEKRRALDFCGIFGLLVMSSIAQMNYCHYPGLAFPFFLLRRLLLKEEEEEKAMKNVTANCRKRAKLAPPQL